MPPSYVSWAPDAHPTALADAEALVALGPKRVLAVLSLSPDEDAPPERGIHLFGPRTALRSGLQTVIAERFGPEQIWLVRWLLGRWPRGAVVIGRPLDGPARLELGLVAPLNPTRIALSQGPLPFPRESVGHIRALHALTQAPGMSGLRLGLGPAGPDRVAGRWTLAPEQLAPTLQHLIPGAPDLADDLASPIVEGLFEDRALSPSLTLEAPYLPEPAGQAILEIGPVSAKNAAGLWAALLGRPQARSLVALCKELGQRTLASARLTLNEEGLSNAQALLSLPIGL